jgi:heat-inducible transcriptional repressor
VLFRSRLTNSELAVIKKYFNTQIGEIEDVLKKTAKVLSEITNYTSVTLMPKIRDALVKNIKFVSLDAYSMLVVIVTDRGVIKDTVVELDETVPDDYLDAAAKFISKVFYNKPLYEILKPESAINDEIERYKTFFAYVTEILEHYFAESGNKGERVILEGTGKLLDYPEYSDINKARTLFQVLDAREKLYPMLEAGGGMDFSVKIGGGDSGDESLKDCAIVTANYSIGGAVVGTQGVIGPVRMDYPLVISVLDSISKVIAGLPIKK